LADRLEALTTAPGEGSGATVRSLPRDGRAMELPNQEVSASEEAV
jgi:hypothetical protein